MYYQLQITMGFISYVEMFKVHLELLNRYKSFLASECKFHITHPAYMTDNFEIKNSVIDLFTEEINKFGSFEQFIKALTILNYHIGNINMLSELIEMKILNSMSFTVTIEEILIVSKFNEL